MHDGIPIGDPTGKSDMFVVPRGIEQMIEYLMHRYPPVFVTENGYSPPENLNESLHDILHDVKRIEFHKAYLAGVLKAIGKGVDVRRYLLCGR